jgi:hypothetical protein
MRSSLCLCKLYRPSVAHIQPVLQKHRTLPTKHLLIRVWRNLAFFCHPLASQRRINRTESRTTAVNLPPDATYFTFYAGTVVDPNPCLAAPTIAHSPEFYAAEYRPPPGIIVSKTCADNPARWCGYFSLHRVDGRPAVRDGFPV